MVQTLANASTFNWASLNDPIKMFFSFEIDRVAPPLFLLVSFTNLKNAWDVNWAENKNFSVKISIFYFLLYYQRAYNLNRGKNLFLCKNLDIFLGMLRCSHTFKSKSANVFISLDTPFQREPFCMIRPKIECKVIIIYLGWKFWFCIIIVYKNP